MSETELAWAAGFFDGEGHARWNRCTNKKWHSGQCRIDVSQTKSPELLERFRDAVGVGQVGGPYGPYNNKNHAPYWQFRCSGDDVVLVFNKLKPFLGSIKKEQIEKALQNKKEFYL